METLEGHHPCCGRPVVMGMGLAGKASVLDWDPSQTRFFMLPQNATGNITCQPLAEVQYLLRNTLYQGRCYCMEKEVAFRILARKSRVQGSRPVSPSGVTCHLCSKGSGGMFCWPCLCLLHSLPPGLVSCFRLVISLCTHVCICECLYL